MSHERPESPVERDVIAASARVWRWFQAGASAAAFLFIVMIAAASIVLHLRHNTVDFLSYWAAGKLAIAGHAASAYDIELHRTVEQTAAKMIGLLPFPYPPPFLFVVTPLGSGPFSIAFPAWIVITAAAYVLSVRRAAPLPYALAHPSVLSNGLIGQNAFITSAVFIGGAELVPRRPYAAGAILGLMVIKPQLAILLPVALLAGREWKAMFAAFLSSVTLLLLALIVFGPGTYRGFLQIVPFYADSMLAGRWPWDKIASVFAFARWSGLGGGAALLIHGAVAAAATALTVRAWWFGLDGRVPTLASAAILVPPYILTYDALFLVSPMYFLIAQRRQPLAIALLWLLCLLPVAGYFGLYAGPNTIPVAAAVSLWALHRPRSAMRPAPSAARAGGPGRHEAPRP